MAQALDLALVIPVWNDAAGLTRLLAQARGLGCFAQIVVVDDGSDPPVAPAPDITLLRHDPAQGGGAARNAGLAAVTAPHVLFFDSDDLLTPDLLPLLDDLAGAGAFDLCLFKHADSRVMAEERWGQPGWDARFWAAAGVAVGALTAPPPAAWPLLVQTANYPWNKIYRTAFLQDHAIRCGHTRVHNDIALHWGGFLAARRVLASDRICAWHHVARASGRLTSRAGPERLEVFAALAPVAGQVALAADPRWRAAFADFALGLVDWVEEVIDPALRAALRRAEADFVAQHLLPWQADLAAQNPGLAQRMAQRAREAGA